MSGDFGKLISKERRKQWLTSKKFHTKMKISCSYTRYTVIEKGAKPFATLELAHELIEKLQIDEARGLFAWVRDLMQTERAKSYFLDIDSKDYSVSPSIVIEDKDLSKMFAQKAIFKEIAIYISMCSDKGGICLNELVRKFSLSLTEATWITNQLISTGIVLKEGQKFKVPNSYWINTPNTPDHRDSTTKAFIDAVNSHFSSPFVENKTIEHSIFRLIGPNQVKEVKHRIRELARWFTVLGDDPQGQPYRLFLGGNYATLGNHKKEFIPYKRDIEKYNLAD